MMAKSGVVLNMYSHTGWKWARREDAEWMPNDFIQSEKDGTIWGLKKQLRENV